MLILDDISVRLGGRLLVTHASLTLATGSKTGFVGRNGTGKSTLFKVITGALTPETGRVILNKNTRIGQVAQEAPATNQSLLQIVLEADRERQSLLAELEQMNDSTRIAEIHARLTDIDAYSAEARASSILHGLGFDNQAQQRSVQSFSGGWRMRVALAGVLFSRPDLLLLDEPTNYLDLEGTLWLINYIRRYPYSVVIISHDRDLLNETTTSIIQLEAKKLTVFRGNYDRFEQQRQETIEHQQRQLAKQNAQRQHMESFVARFRASATKARQAQSRLKALEKLKPINVWQSESVMPIRFSSPEKKAASPIIALENVDFSYNQKELVLSSLNLRIDNDDRIALIGANGNGKTTLAKLLAGRLEAQKGQITRAPHLKIGFFAQHQLDDLVDDETPVDHVRRLFPTEGEAIIRSRVAQMGLSNEKMNTKARDLSGGEKARLLLGLTTIHAPNLLILDEPTNHLDIDSREELVCALNEFDGAVILIAHDRHLINATTERLWLVKDGTVQPFDGDIADYRKDVLSDSSTKASELSVPTVTTETKNELRRTNAEKRIELAPLKKEIRLLEDQIASTQAAINCCDIKLADSELYIKAPDKVEEISKSRALSVKNLEKLEQRWLDLSEIYEQKLRQAT